VLDDADKQSIRDWFRKFVRSREAGLSDETGTGGEGRLARDLNLPHDLTADVKGGTSHSPPAPPPGRREPDQ
jgi:hypothetical protein